MPYDTDSAVRSRLSPGLDPSELERMDRILLGACAGIWLAALGAGVAATVALVDLGRGQPEPSGDSGTPWLLYTVIAISAAVIIGAVPLLLRARREALAEAEPPARAAAARPSPGRPQPPVRGGETPTEKLRIAPTTGGRMPTGPGYAAAWTNNTSLPAKLVTAVDQVWLRFALVIACAIGIAMVLIGVATYLMAVESNVAAWVFYALSALITVAMPVVPVFYLRELRALLDGESAQPAQ